MKNLSLLALWPLLLASCVFSVSPEEGLSIDVGTGPSGFEEREFSFFLYPTTAIYKIYKIEIEQEGEGYNTYELENMPASRLNLSLASATETDSKMYAYLASQSKLSKAQLIALSLQSVGFLDKKVSYDGKSSKIPLCQRKIFGYRYKAAKHMKTLLHGELIMKEHQGPCLLTASLVIPQAGDFELSLNGESVVTSEMSPTQRDFSFLHIANQGAVDGDSKVFEDAGALRSALE